jgi:hypothetical protein
MNRLKELIKKSREHHSLTADAVSYFMYKCGYGDINLAGANSRYKTFTRLEKEFKSQIGKTDFKHYCDEMQETVWICWLQGFENAPELVKSCIASMEYHLKGRRIIYITADNFRDYCDIPEYIIEKWRKGIICSAHFADLLRLALLIQHGGLWIDATVYMTGPLPSYITEGDFFGYRDGFFNCDLINFGNWLIYSAPNNRLLNETYALLLAYWKKYDYAKHYFIFQMFFRMVTDCYPDEWEKVPYFNQMDLHIFSFEFLNTYDENRFRRLCELTPLHKLTLKADFDKEETNSYYSKFDTLYRDTE